mgnify:CR=1 FL=1
MRKGMGDIKGKWMRVAAILVAGVLLCTGCGNGSGDKETERESTEWQDENTTAETGGQQGNNAVASERETRSDETGVPADGETQSDGTVVSAEDEAEGEAQDGATVSLVMVGDILLHTPVAESGLRVDGSYDFAPLFANVADKIESADLALVNQEVIIGGEELGITGYPCFNAPYELGDALADTGFNVILHATNHVMDKGKKGVLNCLEFWNTNYPQMPVLGIHESEEDAEKIYIYEQDGMKIAILNYTYGTNGIALPSDMPYAVDLLEEEKVKRDLEKARELADFVIVCPHWGTEYSLGISAQQEKWTRLFLENGVDLVIGTHPHVIEPVEWVTDGDGREMLVYYSLGNFVNWTSGTGDGVANRMVGGMAEVELSRNEQGEVTISDYDVEPLVCHLEKGQGGVTTYFLKDYSEEMAQKNEIRKQDSAVSFAYCLDLCENVWGTLVEQYRRNRKSAAEKRNQHGREKDRAGTATVKTD